MYVNMMTNGDSLCIPNQEKLQPSSEDLVDSGIVNSQRNVNNDYCGYDLGHKTKVPDKDSVMNPRSSTQLIFSLVTLLLIERGSLDISSRASQDQPQYVSDGEGNLKFGESFARNLGFRGLDDSMSIEDVSEVVRRVDGRNLKQLIVEGMSGAFGSTFTYSMIDSPQCETSLSHQLHPATKNAGTANTQLNRKPSTAAESHQRATPTKLYPDSIPPHLYHPRTCDFSVIDQDPIGRALVTHRRWLKGNFMARFDGTTVPEVMLHTLQKTPNVHLWDPYFIGNLAHSCSPSVMLDMTEHKMWAMKDIEADTVLTMDYASTEDVLFRSFQCRCSAVDCRGEITGRRGYANVTSR